MADWGKISSVALPVAGGVAGGVLAGPAGIGLGASAGQLASTVITAATTKPPAMPGASGAEKGMAAMQRNLAEQAFGQMGLSSGEVANIEDVTFRQNMRNLNLMNEFNAIYNVDPAAQQLIANAMINQIRAEGKDIRKEIATMDAEAIRQSYERASTLSARASAQEAEIRRQEQAQFLAEQEFYAAQAQALTSSVLGFAEAAAGYAEYMDVTGEAAQEEAIDQQLRGEIMMDKQAMAESKAMASKLGTAEPKAATTTKSIDDAIGKFVQDRDYRGLIAYLDANNLPRTYKGILNEDEINVYRRQILEEQSYEHQRSKQINSLMGF